MKGATESTALVAQQKTDGAPQQQQKPPSWAVVISASALMGMLFGLAFYKSHVYEPQIIRGQFLFRRFVMLKVFFGAMGIGALIFSVMARFGVQAFEQVRQLWMYTSVSRGWISGPALGGAILGIGMAASGACPGMVWTALGAGTPFSAITIVGGLFGAFVYGMLAEAIQEKLLDKGPKGPSVEVYADRALGVSTANLTLFLGIFCLAGCAVLEAVIPWKSEVPSRFDNAMSDDMCNIGVSFSFVNCPAWPPSIAGILLGTLQLPAVMLIGNILGSSTAFAICSSVWMMPMSSDFRTKYAHMNLFATPNPKSWWQVIYILLATVAAYLCAKDIDDIGGAAGVGPVPAFLGGFLIIFGSRLGGGCTSGHGLSGCAILMIQSWIAVPAMFAGGIILSVVWQSIGGFFLPNLL
mmetsp:Transcript_10206/g.30152  ORF Transcript_10206/g.30152 Transcript_10206/m.30152 type:complete len:410 (-) Transcript_10206:41-1270(-)